MARFVARWNSATYVVRQSFPKPDGYGRVEYTKPLRAVFHEGTHTFDSEREQQLHGWSDEEREQVENYLRNHIDYNVYIFPDSAVDQLENLEEQVCIVTEVDPETGEPMYCGRPLEPGSDTCARHRLFSKKKRGGTRHGKVTTTSGG
jgi:hypothetical protein